METVFSTRLDERLVSELELAARRLGVTKKSLLENALRAHLASLAKADDPVERAFGAWDDSSADAVGIRAAFDADVRARSAPRQKK